GDDEGIALGQDLLGPGDDVGIGRNDGLDELEGIADEAPCLVGFLDDEARALNTFVENRFLGIGQRQRLVIVLAEINNGHGRFRLDAWHWRRGGGRRSCALTCGLRRRLGSFWLGRLRCLGGRRRRSGRRSRSRRRSRRSLRPPGRAPLEQRKGENTESRERSKARGPATQSTD